MTKSEDKRKCGRMDCGNYLPICDSHCRALNEAPEDTTACWGYMTKEQAKAADAINIKKREGKKTGKKRKDCKQFVVTDMDDNVIVEGTRIECAMYIGISPEALIMRLRNQKSGKRTSVKGMKFKVKEK